MSDLPNNVANGITYQVVSTIPGRIRVKVPLLLEDPNHENTLKRLVESVDHVISVRINSFAYSVIIVYDQDNISGEQIEQKLAIFIQQLIPTSVKVKTGENQEISSDSIPKPSPVLLDDDNVISTKPQIQDPVLLEDNYLELVSAKPQIQDPVLLEDNYLELAPAKPQIQDPVLIEDNYLELAPAKPQMQPLLLSEDNYLELAPAKPQMQPLLLLEDNYLELAPAKPQMQPLLLLEDNYLELASTEPQMLTPLSLCKNKCFEQAELIEQLQDQISELTLLANIGMAQLRKWHIYSPTTIDEYISPNYFEIPKLNTTTTSQDAWEQLAAEQIKVKASLEAQIRDLQRLATIGEARLRKHQRYLNQS